MRWRCRCGPCCTFVVKRWQKFPNVAAGQDSPPSCNWRRGWEWIVPILKRAGKTVWIVVDGGYTKLPFLKRALKTGATVVGRLRKDAALRDLPPQVNRRGRGRPRKYGKHKISLAKRAGQPRGWSKIECTVYGKTSTKRYKTFLATYRPTAGVIRVVLVKEDHGWYAFYCTDPDASARDIWTNLAVYNMNLWMHTLVELWAWNQRGEQLVDRSDSPWDDPTRRPSHANRRKALRAQILQNELLQITTQWSLPRKIIRLTQNLMALAA